MKKPAATVATIDDYIATFPKDVRTILSGLRSTIRKAAPDATEKIVYRMPTFFLDRNLVHFAAFERHIGFYPTPGAIVAFGKELQRYSTSKGAVQFPIDEPIPLTLVAKIVRFRVAESRAKPAASSGRRKPMKRS